jgi:transposase
MLTMVDIEFIRKKHLIDGWSIRQLSRQLGLSRQTVRKALATTTPPRYTLRQPRPSPRIDPVRPLIASWLRADEQAPPKQRHTATRI